MTPPEGDLQALFRRASQLGAAVVGLLGILVLAGWALEIDFLKRVGPSLATMKVNSAISFVLLGGACWFAREGMPRRPRFWLAFGVVAIAAATGLEYVLGVDLGIDQPLFRDTDAVFAPGRVPPLSTLNFLLLGFAVLAVDTRVRGLVGVLIALVVVSSFLALLGYLYGSSSLYAIPGYTSIALHSTLGFLVASGSLVAALPSRGPLALLTSATGAGTLLRGLLPSITAILVLIGWIVLHEEAARYYDASFATALQVASSAVLLSGVTLFIARRLYATEQAERAAARAIRESEARKAAILRSAFDAIVTIDDQGRIVEFNPAAERLLGWRQADVLGRQAAELLVPPAGQEAFRKALSQGFDLGERPILGRAMEASVVHANGNEVPVELAITRVVDSVPRLFTAFMRDTSERRQLERMKERARFFQLSLDMVCIADASGRFLQVSPAFERVLGYNQEELLGTPFIEFVHPDDRPATIREIESLRRGVPTLDFKNRYRAKDGSYRWLQWRSAPEGSLQYGIARDVTDDLERQARLRASLKEREALLQEVHHRVKNNLQLISSLINLQARRMEPGENRTALEECQSRVQAIGLIHQKLYQSRDYANVPFSEYARSLAQDILYASGVPPERVTLSIEMEEIALPVDKAIPCALILNELLTNALRHAFPGDSRGRVRLELRRSEGGEVQLTVADDGVGMSADVDPARSTSLGLEIVRTLVKQLGGHWQMERERGTTFRVGFSLEGRA